MASVVFNTLEYAKRLEAAGFTRQQAEAQAGLMTEIVDERMATKADLREMEARLSSEMQKLEYRLTIRLGAMLAAAVAVLAALVTFTK